MRKICYTIGAAAAAAALTIGGFAVAGAATNACGSACIDLGFINPGGRAILASHSGLDTPGNLVRLLAASNSRPSEDFAPITVGTVVPLYCTASGQAQTGSLFTSRQCLLLVSKGYGKRQTYQLAFDPNNGGPEDECIGATGPKSGDKVRLEPCGVSAGTVLIPTPIPAPRLIQPDAIKRAVAVFWLVNGASDNFSNPNVLTSNGTYPSSPTWTEITYNGGRAVDTQEVCAARGPYRQSVCSAGMAQAGPDHR